MSYFMAFLKDKQRIPEMKVVFYLQWISKYINNMELDYRIINKFYGLLAFEIWYRLFITKEISSEDTLD